MNHRLTRWLGSTLGTNSWGRRCRTAGRGDWRACGSALGQHQEHRPSRRRRRPPPNYRALSADAAYFSLATPPLRLVPAWLDSRWWSPGGPRVVPGGPSPDDFRVLNGRQTPGRPDRRPRQAAGDSPRGFVSRKGVRPRQYSRPVPVTDSMEPLVLWNHVQWTNDCSAHRVYTIG